jgi:hypothetical protein
MNAILAEALRLADLGYAVFPCAPGQKTPITPNGFKDASTNPEQIEVWWGANPSANLAIRTNGLIVIDVDRPDNQWLANLPDRLSDLADAPLSLTPRGGKHFIFRQPADRRFGCTRDKLAPKVDVRADGGYIVAPPSVFEGRSYRWAQPLDYEVGKLPLPPNWLIELLIASEIESVRSTGPIVAGDIVEGGRDETLFRLASSMRRSGMSESEILAALLTANQERCKPPLPESQVRKCAKSGAKYDPDAAAVAAIEGVAINDEMRAEESALDPGDTPSEFLYVPGFIGNVRDFILETAPYPEPTLAFSAALALQAFLASRRVRTIGGARSSLYIVTLANSGAGKDWPRGTIQQVLEDCGLLDCCGDGLGSGEGLEDMLNIKPQFILLADEINQLFESIKSGRDERFRKIADLLLKLYSAADKKHSMRLLAGKPLVQIDQPGLTLYGSAVPGELYGSISPQMLVNGLFARLLIMQSGKRGRGRQAIRKAVPDGIASVANYWASFQPGGTSKNLAAWHPEPIVVPQTSAADRILESFLRDCEGRYEAAEQKSDQAAMTVWARAAEKAARLSLNHACSADHANPTIDEAAANWACRFSRHQTMQMLFMAGAHVAESEFDARCQRAVRTLRTWQDKNPGKFMPAWLFNRRLKGWTPREAEDVRTSLLHQGKIERSTSEHDGSGRIGEAFCLL